MPATALLKFTQGAYVGANGRALIVDAGTAVSIANSNNSQVQSFRVELLYGPPESTFAITPGVQAPTLLAEGNGIPAASITPQVAIAGCYRIRLTVWAGVNYTGQKDVDIRNIAVPTPNKRFIKPPYQKFPDPLPLAGEGKPGEKPDELNFEDLRWGWSGPGYVSGAHSFRLLDAALEELDNAGSGGGALVNDTTQGDVASFPGYPRIFVSDGATPGGLWVTFDSSNITDFIEPFALPLTRINDGGAYTGQFLYWDGYYWTPTDIPQELTDGTNPGQLTYWDGSYWSTTNAYPDTGDIPYWDGSSWTFVERGAALPASNYVGEILWGGGPGNGWYTAPPPSSSAVLVWDNPAGVTEWLSGNTRGQVLYYDGLRWAVTDVPAGGDVLTYDYGSGYVTWAAPSGSSPLVTIALNGIVNYFPYPGYYVSALFATDGATAGGIWVRTLNEFVDSGTLDVGKLFGSGYDYHVLAVTDGGLTYWTKTLRGLDTVSFAVEYDIGDASAFASISWLNAQKQRLRLTGNVAITWYSNTEGPANFMLRVVQDGVGGRTITWPANTRASGGTILLGTNPNQTTLFGIYYDGTNYYVTSSVNIPDTTATTTLV